MVHFPGSPFPVALAQAGPEPPRPSHVGHTRLCGLADQIPVQSEGVMHHFASCSALPTTGATEDILSLLWNFSHVSVSLN